MEAPIAPHPNDQVLHAYGQGKLDDPAVAAAVDSHLEGCLACQQRVSELSGGSFVGRLRHAGAGPRADAAPSAAAPGRPRSHVPKGPDPGLAGTLPPELTENPQYEILRELGRGGMGVVYLARNTLMDRLEVLKVLNKEMLERKGTYDRFLREVRAAARLSHPNVVTAYSAVQMGRLLVFAMEYIEGADLSQLVKTRGLLPVAHACSFASQAALGLQHAHERGMVHRDIKPGNLMLTRQGQRGIIKILDFGLAKASSEQPLDGGLTREGQMLGTPDYIAPEQTLDAQKADIRADIYSLGCTLYYLLTGGPPFHATSLYELLQAHHSMDARPLNLVRPEVPTELAAVVGKMMAKEKEWRYQAPAEVAAALKPFFKSKSVGSGSSDGEHSHPEQPDVGRPPASAGSQASAPAAGAAPVAAGYDTEPPKRPASTWRSLIAIEEPEHLSDRPAAVAEPLRHRPPWVVPALAAGLLLLGFIGAWAAGVLTTKTEFGLLVLEGVPEQAEVLIDGKKVSVRWPNGGGPAKVIVRAGRRGVMVKKDGFRVFGDEVSVATDGQAELKVRLVPLDRSPASRPGTSGAGNIAVEPARKIANSIGMTLVLIPAGEFPMGSSDADPGAFPQEKPQHKVRIARPFYLGATEVTQGQYQAVTGGNPSHFKGPDGLPVDSISWNDAVAFCAELNKREKGSLGGAIYRLPTEAEWEYACRAGTTTRFSFGDAAARLRDHAWFMGNSDNTTHPVREKPPNAWGLYDMNGNVSEWCGDWFDAQYYANSPDTDPPGPAHAAQRVIRGGSYGDNPRGERAAVRGARVPGRRGDRIGFRLALVPPA
jgi:formylglycine-generating enzyme required for sulfatase activity/serine/threonine protein kinase